MTWLWIVPAGVAAVGTAVVVGLARRVAEELAGLNGEVARCRAVGTELNHEMARWQELGGRLRGMGQQ